LDSDAEDEFRTDIDRFITAKVGSLAKLKKYPEDIYLHVQNIFQERAQGSFLWIGTVAEELRDVRGTEVKKPWTCFQLVSISCTPALYFRLMPSDKKPPLRYCAGLF
jgi:hypothetical protein